MHQRRVNLRLIKTNPPAARKILFFEIASDLIDVDLNFAPFILQRSGWMASHQLAVLPITHSKHDLTDLK